MPTKNKTPKKKPIEQYEHKGKKRVNNPPVGLVTPETDTETGKKTYAYDPHIDPSLQWAGKAEHTSFEVPTQSLHVHERIDPRHLPVQQKKRQVRGLQIDHAIPFRVHGDLLHIGDQLLSHRAAVHRDHRRVVGEVAGVSVFRILQEHTVARRENDPGVDQRAGAQDVMGLHPHGPPPGFVVGLDAADNPAGGE